MARSGHEWPFISLGEPPATRRRILLADDLAAAPATAQARLALSRMGQDSAGRSGRRPRSIRWHLLALILTATLPLLAFAGFMVLRSAGHERAALEASLAESARLLSRAVDSELQQSIAALEVLAVSEALASGDLRTFYTLAEKVVKVQPSWVNLLVLGPRGEHLLNVRVPFGTPLPPLNRPNIPIETARSRRPLVSDMEVGVIVGRRLTVITVPAIVRSEVKYVIAAAIEPPQWQALLDSRLPEGQSAMLVDRAMNVVARTPPDAASIGMPVPAALRTAVIEASKSRTRGGAVVDGRPVYAAYDHAPSSGWTVAVMVPASAVDLPVRRSLAPVSVGLGILLLCGLGLGLTFARRIARPIQALTASLQSVGGGGAPLPVHARIAELQVAEHALADAANLLAERMRRVQKARADAEAASAAKDRFVATLSHELRNPLAAIVSAIGVLERSHGDQHEGALRAREILQRQTGQLRRLVDDLLDVARITRGKIMLRRSAIDLGAAARECVDVMRATGVLARHRVEMDVSTAWIDADAVRVEQMITNLLENAVKYTPAGGAIRVRVTAHDRDALLEVADTGIGMPPDLVPRIFELFAQGDDALDRRNGGLGIGLTLVRELATLHGGDIEATSAGPGCGSRFVLRFSLAPAGVPGSFTAASARFDAAPSLRRVLLVEDNGDAREALRMVLTLAGHDVSPVGTGAAAVQAADGGRHDVALIDVGLPDIDGYEVARRIRAGRHDDSMLLVALTGYGEDADRARARAAGFDVHLTKPVDPDRLLELIASGSKEDAGRV